MTPFTAVTGTAALLPRDDVDTDVIIPVPFLRRPKEDLARGLFHNLRFHENGEQTDFILNREGWRDARILVAGRNFGCGSSREHAVWALLAFGIRVVVAAGFGDIFHANSVRMGLVPVALPADSHARLCSRLERAAAPEFLTVSLVDQRIVDAGGDAYGFAFDPLQREMLLKGLDAVALTLANESAIAAFQDADCDARPWVYAIGGRR